MTDGTTVLQVLEGCPALVASLFFVLFCFFYNTVVLLLLVESVEEASIFFDLAKNNIFLIIKILVTKTTQN